jgi:uncharacterized protein YkwD
VGETRDVLPGLTMTVEERRLALEVFDLVNAERARADLPPLAWDEVAADVAYDHCVDMRERAFYTHVNPDGVGVCERLRNGGVPVFLCGAENIARGQESAQEVMAAWMASEGHRANILEPRVTHVGIGVHAGREGPWWTQDFFTLMPE